MSYHLKSYFLFSSLLLKNDSILGKGVKHDSFRVELTIFNGYILEILNKGQSDNTDIDILFSCVFISIL